jgi:hypothetical protein
VDTPLHFHLEVWDAEGHRSLRGTYTSFDLGVAFDAVGRFVQQMTRDQYEGKPIGEGWIRLTCVEDDSKSILAGVM